VAAIDSHSFSLGQSRGQHTVSPAFATCHHVRQLCSQAKEVVCALTLQILCSPPPPEFLRVVIKTLTIGIT